MRDLAFISGQFTDTEIPKDKSFLKKYFKTGSQLAFLKYYLVFEEASAFADHTGYVCSKCTVAKYESRYHALISAYTSAKKNMDLEAVWRIESGKFKL